MGTAADADADAARAGYLCRVHPPHWENPKPRECYDLAVLGAGPAGLAAVEEAQRAGLAVALIERNRLGGDSFNYGTIPSKAIIGSARRQARHEDGTRPPAGDFAVTMARMRRIRARIAEYHAIDRLSTRGVDVFFGDGGFVARRELRVAGQSVRFGKALIATGARPQPANIPGLAEIGYLTSETLLDLTALPQRLTVIGGGPLGCEAAQAFSRLGAQVTLVQNDPKFLPDEERDAAELLSRALARDGVITRLNTAVVGARRIDGVRWVDTVRDEVRESFAAEQILLTIGRIPNIEALGLEAAGVGTGEHGILVDEFLCTANADVYAAGDVCTEHKYTNVAEGSARLAVRNALGAQIAVQRLGAIPRCTYCDPEIAHIGLHVWEARARAIPIKTYTVMMHDVDRAITEGRDEGFVKIHIKDGTDEILGATIVAGQASEMINEMAVIMGAGIGMRQLAGILHTYPAQSGAIRRAALAFVWHERPAP
jgi:pyruvate/2-oxoglutarate dehydrogenase complex dihydrolipoamide dehydrogenase (E3) component